VEFALVIPIFLLFVMGIIEFGNMINRDTMLNNASREAAREGALNPVAADIVSVARDPLLTRGFDAGALTVTPTCRAAGGGACTFATATSGDVVIVTMSYEYSWVTPLSSMLGFVISDGTTTLRKTSEMRIE
jgi:Flp pilus assembly protein TadG